MTVKDQWVPCSPSWLAGQPPNACEDSPRRPGRQGTGVNHYHMDSGYPDIEKLIQFKRVPLPTYHPVNIGGKR